MSEFRHDLLTPINHIIGYSEMLIEELEEASEAPVLEAMRRLHATAQELTTLIHLVLPPGPAPGTAPSLELLLTKPIEIILEETAAVRRDVSAELRERIEPDLQKIQQAVTHLLTLVTRTWPIATELLPAPLNRSPEPQIDLRARILIVDDSEANLEILARRLEREGAEVVCTNSGAAALELIAVQPFDLMLLDVRMPGMSGFEVLKRMRAEGLIKRLPVIMLSAMDEVQSAVRCIELGAEDYLTKPADTVLLRARIGAAIEKKQLRDEERKTAERLQNALRDADEQRRLAESLILNILPKRIAEELLSSGRVIPKYFDDVTIVFTDFVGFSLATEHLAAEELVELLHDYFTEFDNIVQRYGLEKLKTIGDAYMFMGGLPPRAASHPVDAVLASFEILEAVARRARTGHGWGIRIGIHTGPVIAGVVGLDKFAFDVWGETVNYGSRMECNGVPGRVNISERAFSRVKDFFDFEARGPVLLKDGKTMDMYFVKGIHSKLAGPPGDAAIPTPFARRYHAYFDRDIASFPDFGRKPE